MHYLRSNWSLAWTIVFAGLIVASQPSIGRADEQAACPSPSDAEHWSENIAAQECRMLLRFPDVARREGNRLIVSLASGRSIAFEDVGDRNSTEYLDDGEYYYLDTIDTRSHVMRVWKVHVESAGVLLLDYRSGEAFLTGDYPEASPDGQYYALGDASSGPIETFDIEVIRHREGHFQLVGHATRELCGFERWATAPTFMMICYDRPSDKVKQYRVAPDHRGGLVQTETGRALSAEEQQVPYGH